MSTETADQLPIIPETEIIEPIVQCGVLYLGTAPPSPGRRGLDSIQEPFSHRYPVDGTNTVQGIDSVLSIYDNGIQLTFVRQPHTVIFFPISSLIYCASLRFSMVENDQTPLIDWRFVTLDSTIKNQSKHPPLFCTVIQRTQILSGDECHCFITKSDDAALALVRTISEVYTKLKPNNKPLKSPIFYQLDRYGRKISETIGSIYLSPATNDESQLNQNEDYNNCISSINRNYLLDPSFNGFFYRTNTNIIEQWQLWDDDDLTGTRPRPPASPFGQHQGLYHDDLTHEMHQYLCHMDDEENSSSSSCSSSSSKEYNQHHHNKQKTKYDTNQFNTSFLHSQTNPFDSSTIKRSQQTPIIIEKIIPNPIIKKSQRHSKYLLEQPDYIPYSDDYQINEYGEKITKEGNRIIYMDVIQPNIINNKIEPPSPITPIPHSRLHRRQSTHIPIIDLESVENLFHNKKSKQRGTNIDNNEKYFKDHHITTSDMLEIIEGYFEDYKGKKFKLNGHDAQKMLEQLGSSSKKKHRRTISSNNETRRRRSYSTLTAGPSINYVERSSIRPPSPQTSIELQQSIPSVFNNEQVNDYVSSIYGISEKTSQSIKSPSLSTNYHEIQPSNNTNIPTVTNQDYISPFRYMQSSINPLLLHEYRNVFNGI